MVKSAGEGAWEALQGGRIEETQGKTLCEGVFFSQPGVGNLFEQGKALIEIQRYELCMMMPYGMMLVMHPIKRMSLSLNPGSAVRITACHPHIRPNLLAQPCARIPLHPLTREMAGLRGPLL
jgi:hypothetical protein